MFARVIGCGTGRILIILVATSTYFEKTTRSDVRTNSFETDHRFSETHMEHAEHSATVILRDWQRELVDVVLSTPDSHAIHWAWEPAGNVGKTFLARHLMFLHNANIVQLMKKDDMLHMLSKCITTTTRVIVFDLVRAAEHGEVDVVYEVIEMIKDQYLCSGKYDSTSKHLAPMHVIVFANFAPDTTMMSADRWNVHEIGSVAASSPPVVPLSMLALASAADDARASSPPPRAASSPLNPTTPSRPAARGSRRRA